LTDDDALVAGLSRDFRDVELAPADRAMLEFAGKLTTAPQQMQREDVDRLRAHGFDDRAVHDIVVVAAYYCFVNRVADGLGVELEPGWGDGGA
jgi:uncharacterized peroxidase-related enzyme